MKKFQTKTWDKNSLEYLTECPVCKSTKFKKIYKDLEDKVFFCAPGKWNLYKCENCISIYLNPRPDVNSIVKAYKNYYTHGVNEKLGSLSIIAKIKTLLANGYRNWKYNTNDHPSSFIGVIVASVWKNGKRIIDTSMRHVPKPKKGLRLLDVGCGSSDFLLRAKSMGWDVTGVDFDINAVKAAQKKGINVRYGGIEILDTKEEKFDYITMAHILEHVHEPVDFLQRSYDLLNKGGKLWIDTPNITSQGSKIYGKHWRGFEIPRHLVMFSHKSIEDLLRKIGFKSFYYPPYRKLCKSLFNASHAIANSIDPYSDGAQNFNLSKIIKKSEKIALKDISEREFITIVAQKN